ncbi:MAG: lysophospholipid acyltransferase family protein [Thermoanaerobaculia bacterium]|nr:lysophospholipid acyltransferase family protein [Thermoanaerobaculia bacterium]
MVCRFGASLARRQVLELRGLHRVARERDPFVLALNHSQRLEAYALPALLIFHRGGHRIHFLADWAMTLVPLVSTIYKSGGVIMVHGKRPKLRLLRGLRSPSGGRTAAFSQARAKLDGGAPVGVFVEGTINRDPRRLLRGQTGAARLAMAAGVPVVPAGIRYAARSTRRPIGDLDRMTVDIGEPIPPPRERGARALRDLHRRIMEEISLRSGKRWRPDAGRRRHA